MTGRIVVGIDGSKAADAALEWAVGEARMRHARLEVVCGWEIPHYAVLPTAAPVIDPAALDEGASQLIEQSLAELDTTGVEIDRRPLPVPGAMALIERSEHADLVVVGSRGRGGFSGLLLGSVSQQVVGHAHCPVVVVRSSE